MPIVCRAGSLAPSMNRAIRAIIFDIGGPLDLETSFEAAIDADIREGLQREGFVFSEGEWQEANRIAVETCAPSLYRSVICRKNVAVTLRAF